MNQQIDHFRILVLLLTPFVLAAGARVTTANGDEKVPQYVYKTIGARKLTVDVSYPDNWKASDQRPGVVFFSGGAWRSGGTAQFRLQAEYFAKRGQEIYNLLQQRGIDSVILVGVHTNICVSGRPFGLRQMFYFGKRVVLCRDLTDVLFQSKEPENDQFQGTRRIVEHIEKHICPTISSTSITDEPEFRFSDDK